MLANRVIVFSDRPARMKADIGSTVPIRAIAAILTLPDLRRQIFGLLGLDATW